MVFGASRFGAAPHALVKRSGNAGRKVKIVALVFTPLLPPSSALLRRWVNNEKERNSKCVVVQHTRCHRHKMCERILSRLLGFS